MNESEESVQKFSEQVYEQKFKGKYDFVGRIYGKGKVKLRTFCTNLNQNLDCKVSIKWIRYKDTQPHWCVRSTNMTAVENAIKWLVNCELDEWRNIVERQVSPMENYTKEYNTLNSGNTSSNEV